MIIHSFFRTTSRIFSSPPHFALYVGLVFYRIFTFNYVESYIIHACYIFVNRFMEYDFVSYKNELEL